MTMYCIKRLLLGLAFLLCSILCAQDDLTGYLQPKIAINYAISDSYHHNFSLGNRTYIFKDENFTLEPRQIDLIHFSNLKTRDNQSLAFGIQYRFREVFDNEKHNELRLTQQYNITSKPRVIRFGHRLRSEQRLLKKLTIHRFRYRFTIDFPLQGEQLDIGETYLVANTEAILNVSKSFRPQYDQRFTANLGWLFNEGTKFQLGIEYRFENYSSKTENIFFALTSLILTL